MKQQFNRILTEIFKPGLKAIGFKTSGTSFRRNEKDFTLTFDIWKSKWNNAAEIKFWFDAGIFRPDFYEFMFHESLPKVIRTNHCSIQLGGGSLLKKGVPQHMYSLTENNQEKAIAEILNDFDNTVEPFLSGIKNIDDILKFKELDPVYCNMADLVVAFAYAQTGNKEKATELIEGYLSSANYPANWSQRIIAECDRLRINISKKLRRY